MNEEKPNLEQSVLDTIQKTNEHNQFYARITPEKYLEDITPSVFSLMRQYQHCYNRKSFVEVVREYQFMREYIGNAETINKYYETLINLYNTRRDLLKNHQD